MVVADIKKKDAIMQENITPKTNMGWLANINAKLQSLATAIKAEFNIYTTKLKNLKETNYELGVFHYNNGSVHDTIFRFKLVLLIWPDIVKANYFIGRSYVELSKLKKAASYIQKYLESGDQQYREEAKFCYDIINNRPTFIKSIPNSLIARHYDILAKNYDSIYSNPKIHNAREQLMNAISRLLTEVGRPFGNDVLDVGCGTGALAKLIKSNKSAKNIEGIDISKNMINEASKQTFEGTALYNKLENIDLSSFTTQVKARYDIILAFRVLNYYPDIENFLTFCKGSLNSLGIIGIAVNYTPTVNQFDFNPELEEFAFNLDFLKAEFSKAGLIIKNEIEVNLSDKEKTICFVLLKE